MSVMYLITAKTITRICWIAINLSCLTFALKDVYVTIPTAVKRGDNANLTCRYDLENDTLYSIKWYKGKREFYRYTPQEIIPMKVFSVAGITVERSMSNASNVMLTSMESTVSGKYSCEVSADAPTFHTVIVSGELEVVDLPQLGPTILNKDKIYSIGDILQANCTLNNSKPSANLTWLINNYMVMPHQIIHYNVTKDIILSLETSVLGLKLVLTSKHFRSKTLRLGCKAKIYEIYENFTEKLLDLDANSNQILADDFSTIGSSRHTQYDNNEFGDPDIKMHHIQASPDMSSSASSRPSIFLSKTCSIFLLTKTSKTITTTTAAAATTATTSSILLLLLFRISSVSFTLMIINWLKLIKKKFIINIFHHYHQHHRHHQRKQNSNNNINNNNNNNNKKINFEEDFLKMLKDIDKNNYEMTSNNIKLPLNPNNFSWTCYQIYKKFRILKTCTTSSSKLLLSLNQNIRIVKVWTALTVIKAFIMKRLNNRPS